MGMAEHFDQTTHEYLRQMLDVEHPLLKGITLERLQREEAVPLNRPPEPYVGFRDLTFKTPSGRIELYKEELRQYGAELPFYHEPIEASSQNELFSRYPLTLLFSHSRHRIHSSFANLAKPKAREPEPLVEIHPQDVEKRRLKAGDLVRVFNQRGSVSLKCRINPDLKPGVVVIAEGTWARDFPEGDPYSLTHERISATSENYAFFDTLVEIAAAEGQ
jgi:anaerobic selenocysteine-containing dehydrogenase